MGYYEKTTWNDEREPSRRSKAGNKAQGERSQAIWNLVLAASSLFTATVKLPSYSEVEGKEACCLLPLSL